VAGLQVVYGSYQRPARPWCFPAEFVKKPCIIGMENLRRGGLAVAYITAMQGSNLATPQTSVADPGPFDTDPDPAVQFEIDPDPTV
jgi:hypothetical protein